MGRPKAALDWHGQPLLARVAGILARCGLAPVVAVAAPGMALPPLPPSVEVVEDREEGRGPLAGLARGLAAVEHRAERAFAAPTDAPFLSPGFVAAMLGALEGHWEAAAASAEGRLHPLPAAYRTSLRSRAEALLGGGRASLLELLAASATRRLDARDLEHADPALDSLVNLNDEHDYARALARPLPCVRVDVRGAPGEDRSAHVRAATLGTALAAVGIPPGAATARLRGGRAPAELWLPLVEGDQVEVELPAAD